MRMLSVPRSLAVLASAAAYLAPGAPALAAEIEAIDRVPILAAGPAISGDRIAYGISDSHSRSFRVLGSAIDQTPSDLYVRETPTIRGGLLGGVAVALSPTRTAFAFGETAPAAESPSYQRALTGLTDAPFAFTAGDAAGRVLVDAVDLSGDILLTTERMSSGARAMVRDLAAGTPAFDVGDLVLAARVAEPYVAVATRFVDVFNHVNEAFNHVSVTNWRTGAELYAVDVPVTPPYGVGFGLDVQEDGTIAVRTANPASTGAAPKVDLAWASAAAPTPHTVATDVGTQITRISGGRILFERAHGPRTRELATADLAGNVRSASFPMGYVTGADLDGSKIAFATTTCVYAGDLPETAPKVAPPGTCPQHSLALTTGPSSKKGAVKVTVGCVMAASNGCAGMVTLQTPKAKRRKVIMLATKSYRVAAGRERSFTVTIPKRKLNALRARVGTRRTKAIIDVVARAKDEADLTTSTRRDASVRLR